MLRNIVNFFFVIFLFSTVSYGSTNTLIIPKEIELQLKREKREKEFIPTRGIFSPGNDFPQNQIITAFGCVPIYSLPSRLPINCIYSLDNQKFVIKQLNRFQTDPFLAIFGPVNNKINYIVDYPNYHEIFAHTRQITFTGRIYPLTYPTGSGHDRGHGIDLADTIDQPHNSNLYPLNYVPQEPEYNQKMKRILVDHIRKNNGSYGEITLYSQNSKTLTQTVQKKYSQSGSVERQQALIPEGFIFKEIYQNQRTIYFFPNHLNYSALINANVNYIELAKRYEIRNAHKILQPFIYDPLENIRTLNFNLQNRFFMGLNIINIGSSFLNRDISLPYFWDSRNGFEISRQFDITSPILPRNISEDHKDLILGFFSKKLLEEAGKYEFSTINIRLALASLFSKVFKDERTAKAWIANLHSQIRELSYGDILRILKVYIDIFENRDQTILNSLSTSLTANIHLASLEERLETDIVKYWNPYLPISGELHHIRTIGPENSAILRKKFSEFSATLELINLVNKTSNLTEVSFEDLSLCIEEKKLRFRSYGQSFSFSPLREMFFRLEKHSPSLKKMNFSGIKLNGERIGDEILEVLNLTHFPNLEYLDLSFTGVTGSQISSSFQLLSNFQRLKYLNLNYNSLSQKAIDDIINVTYILTNLKVSIQDNDTFLTLPRNFDENRIKLTFDMQQISNPAYDSYENSESCEDKTSSNYSSSRSNSDTDEDGPSYSYDSDDNAIYRSESDGDSD